MRRVLLLGVLATACAGCNSSGGDGMSAADVKKAEDVNAMAKSSGGDWSKLTPQQQQEMIQQTGSEGTAKQVLDMKAHPPAPIAPGRPSHPGP